MEENGRNVSVYRGIWICFVVMIASPVIPYFILRQYMDLNMTIALCATIGFCFTNIVWLVGFLNSFFKAFIDRIRETNELFGGFFTKEGFKWYWRRFIDDGAIIVYLFFLVLFAFAAVAIIFYVRAYEESKEYFATATALIPFIL